MKSLNGAHQEVKSNNNKETEIYYKNGKQVSKFEWNEVYYKDEKLLLELV